MWRPLPVAFLSLATISAAGGDVEVEVNAEGDLVVSGDAQANGVVLFGYKGPPYEVRGEPGTTINGGPGPFVVPFIRGRILVDLGPGDDRLDSTLGARRGSVIRMGDGADRLVFGDIYSADLRADLGAGDDTLDVQDSGFGRLLVEAGAGNDVVVFAFSGADTLAVRMDDGNDSLTLWYGYFDETVAVHGGSGTDELELVENDFRGSPPKIVGFETVEEERSQRGFRLRRNTR